jgi:hypothetical protein
MINEPAASYVHLAVRRSMVLVAVGMLTLTAACAGGESDEPSASASTVDAAGAAADAASAPSPSNGEAAAGAPIQLDLDPCSLLTVPEIEVAVGPGVEHGGFGDDTPGRCTYSVRGDVGAGVVGIAVDEPLMCEALLRALDAGSLDPANAVRVDVGDGAIFEKNAGSIQVSVGGGCLGITGSTGGESLGQEALVALATSAVDRVG